MPSCALSLKRYLQVGLIVTAASGISAAYLNVAGVKCLSSLNSMQSTPISPNDIEGEREACFIITNAYVYSLFGVVAGVLILVLWARKRKVQEEVS
jgi:hypothetical protein